MGLDVYLTHPDYVAPERWATFVREGGQTREISREEWDRRHPGVEPTLVRVGGDNTIYHGNITHNLAAIADAANLYEHLWLANDLGIKTAGQMIEPLRAGLAELLSNPAKFIPLNPGNGWGSYNGFVAFVEAYLRACEAHPTAEVTVSR